MGAKFSVESCGKSFRCFQNNVESFPSKKVYYSVILRKKSRFQPFLSPKTGGKSVKTENGILYLVKNGVFFPQRKSILFDFSTKLSKKPLSDKHWENRLQMRVSSAEWESKYPLQNKVRARVKGAENLTFYSCSYTILFSLNRLKRSCRRSRYVLPKITEAFSCFL